MMLRIKRYFPALLNSNCISIRRLAPRFGNSWPGSPGRISLWRISFQRISPAT